MTASCALSVWALVLWAGRIGPSQGPAPEVLGFVWLPVEHPAAAQVSVGVLADSLSVIMCSMVGAIGALIHVFSMVFWKKGRDYSLFFAFLGLFCASMLGVVVSSGLVELFACWSLVGLCSYLMICFGFEKEHAITGATKAFIIQRIGDASFLVGLAILVLALGQWETANAAANHDAKLPNAPLSEMTTAVRGGLNFFDSGKNNLGLGEAAREATGYSAAEYLKSYPIYENVMGLHWLTWAGLCLLGGVMAKSAQFPLHVWLPEAAEAPAPAMGLMFAASTVTAGVYTAARLFPILTFDARLFLAMIAATTLVVSSLLALVATDLKKVLAYAAMTQAAFMLLFLGAGGYVASLFALVTQGFCLAGLCLAAGSVQDGCAGQRELSQMGGLWRRLPITALTFGVTGLALAGAPFLSGWYAQRLGMGIVFDYAMRLPEPYGASLYWIAAGAAGVTAYSMCRVWWLVFAGHPRDQELHDEAQEHPLMTLPLIVLAMLAVLGGMLGIRELLEQGAGALNMPRISIVSEGSLRAKDVTGQVMLWGFGLGVMLALGVYWRGFARAEKLRRLPVANLVYFWLKNGMFFDLLYEGVLAVALVGLGKLARLIDRYVVGGLISLAVWLVRITSKLCGILEGRE